jgi:hypothetical protein
MGYKVKGGRIIGKRRPLYHFTAIGSNLLDIERDGLLPFAKEMNAHMLPGREAVWLTADPEGNAVTEAHLAYMRNHGEMKLAAKHTVERPWLFGANEHGSARITVDARHAIPYLDLMRANYADDGPGALKALANIEAFPGAENWFVSFEPIPAKRVLAVELTVTPLGEKEFQFFSKEEAA